MPETIDWVFYDLVASGTTESVKKTFFSHDEPSDGLQVTNMPIAGQIPSTQKFELHSIEFIPDVEAATGDLKDLLDAAVLELYVNEKRMLSAPLIMFCANSYLIPMSTESTVDKPQLAGTPYKLEKPITISGGDSIKVEVTIGKTAVSASMDMIVCLKGLLTRPD